MHSLVYYAMLGSLMAGAAGTFILVAVAVTYTLKSRRVLAGDLTAEDRARRRRVVRLGDAFALLCFAASAGLAIVGVVHQVHLASVAPAAVDRGAALARLDELEKRLASIEAHQRAALLHEANAR
jgi:hypothetical protein